MDGLKMMHLSTQTLAALSIWTMSFSFQHLADKNLELWSRMFNTRNTSRERYHFFFFLISAHISLDKFNLQYSWFYLVPTYTNSSGEGTLRNPGTGVLALIPKLSRTFQRDPHKAA